MSQKKGYALLLQEQNRDVARKLGSATLAMFTLPILAFYVGLHFLFTNKEDPLMWSGGLAVFFANVVIVGYVVSAFSEEDDEPEQRVGGGQGDGDEAGPRVGAFKQRTD
ncbi:hypothetical protein QTG54_001075 [Skeletonema marinoi]|uniref:Vacuolar ATPase assembly integral membrane protein VMA21 homolog n=1 Tax=Skeletonema marinoi TaxID=267567 RepID=A0AAD8YM50_9STRA|nr:hypothetical protein QTG54_001075 [Skeletonema marinoi]|mmetsp:Transcript_27680/g.55513  ORF Transcript_27680/g.55513 Transcript_27680/m.55513 type:complete len:109 (-) Transcript_27680:104-430(-)